MFTFKPEVEDVLRGAGWSPTRSVPVDRWINDLVDVGYKPFPVAITILENLGGLEIVPPTDEANLFFPGKIVFDPVYAASSEVDRVEAWQEDYNLSLFPLGEFDPIYILLCSTDGSMFGAREQSFYFLGASIEDALELLVFARRRLIPYPKHRT